jgi:nucleotide-binding universal stress UspA family protein
MAPADRRHARRLSEDVRALACEAARPDTLPADVANVDLDAGCDRRVRADRDGRGHHQARLSESDGFGYDRRVFKSIVVGTDGSDTANQAVRQAVDLAKALGAEVELVSAYEPVPAQRLQEERRDAPEDLQWAISPREDVDATLEAAAVMAREAGVTATAYPRQGDPADAILDVAEEREADLIVVGNKGMTGAKRFLLGSVPNKISHHAPCSVLIIRTT